MKWKLLQEYIEHTLAHGKTMGLTTSQEQGFLFALEDIQAKMDSLEAEHDEQ